MTGKKRRVVPIRAFLLHTFRPILAAIFAIMSVTAAHASSPGKAEMLLPDKADACKPADISLHDKSIRAGLLYDVSADAVVWEKNRYEAFPIASLTKMMVAFLAMEDIADGKVDLSTIVKVTPEAAKMNGSKVYLRTGCCLTVEALLKAAMISSGNDAAYLLAQFLGGTEPAFVRRMNRRAARLGMNDTFYSNATGMPARDSRNDNRSSPADLLLLSMEMLKYKDLLEIAGMDKAIITQDNRPINLRNHNGLVATYDDVDGFKTGFTLNAKYCLVATANKGGRRLISIVLGASGRNARNQFTAGAISSYYEALGMGGLEPKTGFEAAHCGRKSPVATVARETGLRKKAKADGNSRFYQVRKGDTLFRIAARNGCEVSQLKAWNHIRGNAIHPGQKLAIHPTFSEIEKAGNRLAKNKKSGVAKSDAAAKVRLYKVRRGDTLWKIAQKFEGVTVQGIMKANRIKKAKDLKPGTTLKIVMDA